MPNISSRQPRKQRLQRLTAPHHRARKQMASHLSEELLLKYNRRSLTVVKGDEVKLMRGGSKGKTGRVVGVDARARKVTVDGVTHKKADGTDVALPVDPSNLLLVKLNLEDARRRAKLEETANAQKGEPKVQKASKAGQPKKGAAKPKPAGEAEKPAEAKPAKEEKPVEA
ncbi:MAG: 50S ribosomal protein L24 [Thermoplasmatota archaeon]